MIPRQNKFEFINFSRVMAGLPRIGDLSTDTSDDAKNSLLFYEKAFVSLLGKVPWNFATKRVRLKRSDARPVDSYRYLYEQPEDALFLWDLYNYGFENIQTVAFFSNRLTYTYFTFPLYEGFVFGDRVAEIIGGKVASDFSDLSALYVPNREFKLEDVTQQFYDTLHLDLEEIFMKARASDEEALNTRLKTNEEYKRQNKAQAGMENRKARKVPEATTIQNIRNRMFY